MIFEYKEKIRRCSMAIVPKGKVSKARRNSRKANWKISTPSMVECPHCHELKANHRVCKKCGYYDGEQKVVVEKEKKETK
jgi:large subunit ribosomal protein L32